MVEVMAGLEKGVTSLVVALVLQQGGEAFIPDLEFTRLPRKFQLLVGQDPDRRGWVIRARGLS